MAAKDEVGRCGEDVAARELVSLGWEVLDAQLAVRAAGLRGEIDIVAGDGGDARRRRGQDPAHGHVRLAA